MTAESDGLRGKIGRICHKSWHVKQAFDWDCGVSCIRMLISSESHRWGKKYFNPTDFWVIQTQNWCSVILVWPYSRTNILSELSQISEEEGFGKSTWTIDLCYLLKRLGFINFEYCSVTLSIIAGKITPNHRHLLISCMIDLDGKIK